MYKKRSYTKRKYVPRKTVAQIAKKVFDKNVENKYQTFDFTPTLISTAGSLINVNVIGQGTAQNQRVGNRLKITSVRFKGFFINADTYNVVRLMVLWSRAPLNIAGMPIVQNPINPATQNFKILYDKTYTLESNSASGMLVKPINTVYRKINGNSTYNGSSSTPDAGYLYFYFVSDSALTPHPSFNGMAIMSYQDA